jgi:hypothetical protein
METLDIGPAPAGTPKFVSDLDTLIRARYPLIYLVSWEEQRLDAILQEVAQNHGKVLLTWSVTRGLRRVGSARTVTLSDGSHDPVEALTAIAKLAEPSLVVLKDFHPFFENPAAVRAMRELAQDLKATYTTVILLSPVLTIPIAWGTRRASISPATRRSSSSKRRRVSRSAKPRTPSQKPSPTTACSTRTTSASCSRRSGRSSARAGCSSSSTSRTIWVRWAASTS